MGETTPTEAQQSNYLNTHFIKESQFPVLKSRREGTHLKCGLMLMSLCHGF